MKNAKRSVPKDFDAIKFMREIRDQLSREIMDMTYEEEKTYLRKLLDESKNIKDKEPNLFLDLTL